MILLPWLIGAAVLCGLTGLIGFILYVRFRMKGDERREAIYLNLHYGALFLLFILGVIIMLYMGEYA